MDFNLILFYIFSFILISSATLVVSSRNMVHCVLFLILAFMNAAALFILLGAEFIGMLTIIVYVGAIAVLFLFVVMMLNVDKSQAKKLVNKSIPLLISVAVIFFLELFLILKLTLIGDYQKIILFPISEETSNISAIGSVLYTEFFLPFQISGAILFVAMIGAIVLTLNDKKRFIRKQKISDQTKRNQNNSVEIVKVKSGEGVNL